VDYFLLKKFGESADAEASGKVKLKEMKEELKKQRPQSL
jgi:hypothetical protein